MRDGIRDFLLVMSVLCGGLAISAEDIRADDPPPASAGTIAPATEPAAPAPATDQAAPSPPGETPAATPAQPAPPGEVAPAAVVEPGKPPEAAHGDAKKPAESTEKPEQAGGAQAGDAGHDPPLDKPTGIEPDATDGKQTKEEHGKEGHAGEEHAGENHAGDHDPHDLSHVNATASLEDPSQIRSDLAIWTMVVFLCLLALLAKFAWGPIMEGLERRESSIAAAIDEAEQAAAKGAEQLKLYEAKLAAAADETREILAQARKDAEATGERMIAEAKEAAIRERDKAIADISAAKNSALQEITERSVDLAVTMAGRMIQRQLTPDDRAGLIRDALDQLTNQN